MAQDPNRQILDEVLRRQMPGLKTQGQYDAVVIAWDACRLLINALLEEHPIQAEECQKAFISSLELIKQATEFSHKLEESPEAATSPFAEVHKTAPKEFEDIEIQQRLLEDLKLIMSKKTLDLWYSENKTKLQSVQNKTLRNDLFDAIRSKRKSLNAY